MKTFSILLSLAFGAGLCSAALRQGRPAASTAQQPRIAVSGSFLRSGPSIVTGPSKFRLMGKNVSFKGGETCAYRNDESDFPQRKEIQYGSILYYDSRFRSGSDEGLVIDDLATKKCRVLPL